MQALYRRCRRCRRKVVVLLLTTLLHLLFLVLLKVRRRRVRRVALRGGCLCLPLVRGCGCGCGCHREVRAACDEGGDTPQGVGYRGVEKKRRRRFLTRNLPACEDGLMVQRRIPHKGAVKVSLGPANPPPGPRALAVWSGAPPCSNRTRPLEPHPTSRPLHGDDAGEVGEREKREHDHTTCLMRNMPTHHKRTNKYTHTQLRRRGGGGCGAVRSFRVGERERET